MRLHRFLVSESLLGESISISDMDLLHQWMKVLRYTGGEQVVLIDGKGGQIMGVIDKLNVREARIRVVERESQELQTRPALALCFSPLKRELTELVLQKGTELGVAIFQPILCERTIKDRLNQERLERILKEATEQSGRVWLPEIRPFCTLKEAIELFGLQGGYFASLQATDGVFHGVKDPTLDACSLFIGPEGGWTAGEEQFAIEKGLRLIKVSAHVLRAETACIAGIALLQASIA